MGNQILNYNEIVETFSGNFVEFTYPNWGPDIDVILSSNPPRVIKSHLRYEYFEKKIEGEAKLKTIILLSNPKDTMVSFYHFYKSHKSLGDFQGTFSEWFEMAKIGRLNYGDLFEWYQDWWSKKDQENILVLKYEDTVKYSVGQVHQIAKFCGKEFNDEVILT